MISKPKAISVVLAATIVGGVAAPASAGDPATDRYIVSFLDQGKAMPALAAAGARLELELPRHEAAAISIPPQALAGLQRNPHIEFIEPDVARWPMAQTTTWGITAVQASSVNYNAASGLTVCIIDSGYSLGHEDLPSGAGVTASADPGTGDPFTDGSHHGTHVAGTIAALSNGVGVVGVVPGDEIKLHIVKVFGDSGTWAYSSTLVAALDKCIEEGGANIVSMSLGGSFKSRTEQRAFSDAFNNGVLSVAAAGNDGNTRKSYPASYDAVMSVAAVDSALTVADFSQQNDQVEVAAPGVAVRSTVPMGQGSEESLLVGGSAYEATAMQGSPAGSANAALFRCQAVDGLGSPGDCAGASGKVCLIERGAISFAEKVQECASNGGVAAIIYNNAPALFSGTLGGAASAIQSVGVSGADGAVLQTQLGQSATVTTDNGNYAYFDGTSMATPHVSGVAALVWSQDSACSNQDIRNALTGSALDLGAPGRDNAYGYGLVQAAQAVAALNCTGGNGGGGGSCDLLPAGDACTGDAECCSGNCKGKPGSKTCK